VWIFKGSINSSEFHTVVATNLNNNKSEVIPFSLGIPGCDNKIAAMLKEKGMQVEENGENRSTHTSTFLQLEKIGMKKEGLFREHVIKWGKYEDVVTYGILRKEWQKRQTLSHNV